MLKLKKGNCRGDSTGRFVQHIVWYENDKGKKSRTPKKGYVKRQRNIVHLLGSF
ncbi:MAG: hypothetical protein R3209_15550 [Salinimicrobium sediminis]|nr:hypothetical protein [Salinimicrobium sediminis]